MYAKETYDMAHVPTLVIKTSKKSGLIAKSSRICELATVAEAFVEKLVFRARLVGLYN
jgi:hypothetical protein